MSLPYPNKALLLSSTLTICCRHGRTEALAGVIVLSVVTDSYLPSSHRRNFLYRAWPANALLGSWLCITSKDAPWCENLVVPYVLMTSNCGHLSKNQCPRIQYPKSGWEMRPPFLSWTHVKAYLTHPRISTSTIIFHTASLNKSPSLHNIICR